MNLTKFNTELVRVSENLKPYALKMTQNHEDAKDLIQETLYKAVSSRNRFQTGTNLQAWCYTIMRNIFINQYRRKKLQNTFTDQTENAYYLENTRTDFNRGESNMAIDEVYGAVNKLDAEYKKPLMLHQSGFKYKEISEKLKIPMGTVKSRIFCARKKLKDYLADPV